MIKVLTVVIFFNPCQIFLQVTVSVWKTMSEKTSIVSMLKGMSESERVVRPEVATLITFVLILVVVNTFSDSVPSNTFSLFYFI